MTIPTEDEWYKAAYYNPATASYWNFATSSNNTPSNGKDYPWDTVGKLTPPFEDPGNSVCYLDGDNDLTYDSSAGEDWHMTEVGTFTNSASPYGTFDQSGNVWNWNESIISGQARSIRGGSWRSYYSPLRAANRLSNMEPGNSSDSSGFRLSLVVPGPPPGSPEIRIETSSLDFDCTDSGGGEAQAMMTMEATTADELLVNMSLDSSYTKDEIEQVAGITPQFKLTDAERIESQFAAGQETVKVIVNLVKPRQLKAMAQFKTRSKLSGKQRKQAMLQRQQEIADLQDAVIDSVKANITMKTNGKGKAKGKFKLGHRFKNISGFSAEVTYEDLETLKNDPFVRSIEPVFELTAHLQQGLPLMNALATRPLYNGMGLSIAICDTGIDSTHPRLDGGKVIGGYDFGDSDGDPSPNGQAHGTCCAGIAAGDLGTVGDYIGGIANGAKLYDLKISHGTGGSAETAAMVAAWDWCITHQYDDPANPIMVVSTSFGGGSHSGICDGEVESMTDAAAGLNAAGITVLASSGNDGYTAAIGWPACISNVVSVGAVYDAAGSYSFSLCDDPDAEADRVTCYSNSADILDILAPSNNAYTTDIVGSDGYSSGDYSATFGGTSAACPYAAGAVAALQSAAKETTGSYLSPEEVLSRLNLSGVPIADVKVPSIIKPRVDLGEAIASLDDSFETFEIYNDGQRILDVNAINKPDWVTLLPQPPYSVNPNDKVSVLAVVDCDNCGGGNLSGQLKIYSSDSDKSPYPDAVYVYKKCCQWRGSLDNTCDVDFTDFAMFASKWLDDTCLPFTWCSGADFDRSGEVDMTDLNQLAENWLK
ncbi:MAG: hypothetical protein B6I25_02240 [Planctomycetales bacterium 4572_13]|nr:MAG: hypothetical protein B6I25_02240 [Planctomycetales bacterium 4572_13]